jgi:predicted ATPase
VVLISGEAGSGKTTLVAEAARAAFDNGACVLLGRCEEDLATPYQLFAEAIGHFVVHANEQQLRAHVAEHGPELARLTPGLARRLPGLPPSKATDPDAERYLLFAAVVGLLATASHDQPIVVVLDDLQWADQGSLHLLRHLAAADLHMRVLVIGVYRDTELSRAHPLLETLGALRRHGAVERIELGGLDEAGVVSFLAAAAGHVLDDAELELARAVYRETDGNPFFVAEVLHHLSETGAVFQNATGRWTTSDTAEPVALPTSIRDVIGGRVVRLGAAAEHAIPFASVIGRDFELEVLAGATQRSEDDLLEVLDAASAAALVRELADTPGHYTFAHALIQHAVYEELGPTRRARAHRRVAEVLEAISDGHPGDRVGGLAHHWLRANHPDGHAKALDYFHQAADTALAALAPGDALAYYAQAPGSLQPRPAARSGARGRPGHRARDRPAPNRGPGLSRHTPRRRPPRRRPV